MLSLTLEGAHEALGSTLEVRLQRDALIYEEFIADSGLRWGDLVKWWQWREGIAQLTARRAAPPRRLLRPLRVVLFIH